MSGIIGLPNIKGSGVVGPAPETIIKHNAFTAQNNAYTSYGDTWKTSGNGWSGTTTSQTSKLIVFATGEGFGHWDANYGSTLPRGTFKLAYHSDSTTQGSAPSGSDLGSEVVTGGYTTGISGRKDLTLSWTLYVTVSVSASTAYHIQVAIKNLSGHYHYMGNKTTGFVMEVK